MRLRATRLGVASGGAEIPLPRRVRSILSKYGASLLIPGAGEPVLGPELVPTSLWGAVSSGVTRDTINGTVSFSGSQSAFGLAVLSPENAIIDRLYSVSFTVTGSTQGGVQVRTGGVTAYVSGNGVFTSTQKAITATQPVVQDNGAFGSRFNGTVSNISVREILTYTNTYSTFVSGNYVESTGQTLTPVDGAVGLVVDAAGVPGAELVTNGDNEAHLVTLVAVVRGVAARSTEQAQSGLASAKYTCTDAASGQHALTVRIIGATQSVVVECWVYAASGNFGSIDIYDGDDGSWITASVTAKGQWAKLQGIRPAKGSVWSLRVGDRAATSNLGQSFYVDNISVRELPGIHATQATSQNKPAVRRGLVNQLWPSDPSSASWQFFNPSGTATRNGNVITFGASAVDRIARSGGVVTAVVGQTYTGAALLSGSGSIRLFSFDGLGATVAVNNITLTSTPTLYLSQFTSTQAGSNAGIGVYNNAAGVAGASFTFHSAALFAGTVTAAEILAAGGIPVTTDVPKSSAIGPQYWQLDGQAQRLRLSAVPFQTQDDFVIVVAARQTLVDATTRRFISVVGATSAIELLAAASTGQYALRVQDDAGLNTTAVGPNPSGVANTDRVFTGRKAGNVKTIRLDGAVVGTNTIANGPSTNTTATIGAQAAGFGSLGGGVAGVILIKGAISDSELLTLERFLATLQGRRI